MEWNAREFMMQVHATIASMLVRFLSEDQAFNKNMCMYCCSCSRPSWLQLQVKLQLGLKHLLRVSHIFIFWHCFSAGGFLIFRLRLQVAVYLVLGPQLSDAPRPAVSPMEALSRASHTLWGSTGLATTSRVRSFAHLPIYACMYSRSLRIPDVMTWAHDHSLRGSMSFVDVVDAHAGTICDHDHLGSPSPV